MSEQGEQHNFDRSLTDLMAGVAVVFLLLAVVFILKANKAARKAEEESKKAVEQVAGQRDTVETTLTHLHGQLAALNARMDGGFLTLSELPDGGLRSLEIEFDQFAFGFGRCATPADKVEMLQHGALPLVEDICGSAAAMADGGAEPSIVLEGHTDDRRFATRSPECGVTSVLPGLEFDNNVRASAARAQSVFFTIRDKVRESPEALQCLDKYFVVAGRGQAAPKHPEDPSRSDNRRLVIRVRGDLRL
jgi:hypothetical protein